MLNNNLSWINLNATGGSGGGVSDYNQLSNKPITKLIGTSQNPIKLWKLNTGLYIFDGYVQHTTELASEAKGLFASVTAGTNNGKYVISAFIPFWEGQYEYTLDSLASEIYNEHQIVLMATQYDVLTIDNEMEYTPTQDYHPSTKKYVDDMMGILKDELAEMGVSEENIQSLIAENRRRDIAIQALLSLNSDKTVTLEEETHTISLDYSTDEGMVTVNSMEGCTLVNVCNEEGSVSLPYEKEMVYLYNSTVYTVQFISSGAITADITLGGATVSASLVLGLNKVQITTPSTLVDNKLIVTSASSCTLSEIVVVNSTQEFDYFKGMKSTFEDTVGEEGYNAEIAVYNAPVRFGKGGRL